MHNAFPQKSCSCNFTIQSKSLTYFFTCNFPRNLPMWPGREKNAEVRLCAIHHFENLPKTDSSMIWIGFSSVTLLSFIFLKNRLRNACARSHYLIVMGKTEAVKMSPAWLRAWTDPGTERAALPGLGGKELSALVGPKEGVFLLFVVCKCRSNTLRLERERSGVLIHGEVIWKAPKIESSALKIGLEASEKLKTEKTLSAL